MRDEDRLREKIQLSLEGRQVALLAVCALVLLGGVFALGLLVGKQLASSAPQAIAAGDLAALDAQPPALAPRPAKAEPRQEPPQETRPDQKAEPKEAPKAEPRTAKAEPKAAAKAERKPEPRSAQLADAEEDPVPESGKPPEEAPPPKYLPQSPPPAVVIEAAPRPVAIEPPPRPVQVTRAVAVTPPPAAVGNFTVQIGASQDRGDAQRLEARARSAGLKPYLIEANLGAKGAWYRIRVGAFASRDAATRFRKDVERELRVSAVVMPTR